MLPVANRDPDGKRIKVSLTISSLAHAGILAWGLVTFSAKPFAAAPVDSLPVDIISDSEFSQLTAGVKTAPRADTPKPFVEKVADATTPVKDLAAKVSAKPEIAAASDKPPAPPLPPAPEKKPEAQKQPEPKVDPIAEALKKEEARKQEEAKKREEQKKKEEAKKREEQKKREEARRRDELNKQIENKLALLDKQEARRHEATGSMLNPTPALGSPLGSAATLSQNELDALRAQLQACWSPPIGLADAKDLVVVVRIQFNRDGSVAADPTVMNSSANPLFQIAAETAKRAVLRCQPYRLPVAKYDVWKDVEVNFDPRDMFRS